MAGSAAAAWLKDGAPVDASLALDALAAGPAISDYLAERGLILSGEGRSIRTASGDVTLVLPLTGPAESLTVDPFLNGLSPKFQAALDRYNTSLAAGRLWAASRHLIILGRNRLGMPLLLQTVRGDDGGPAIVTLSSLAGDKLVVAPGAGLAAVQRAAGGSETDQTFSEQWACLLEALGLEAGTTFSAALSELCDQEDDVQKVLLLSVACSDCGGDVSTCSDCVAGWTAYLDCGLEDIIACWDPGQGGEETELANNEAVDFSLERDEEKFYRINVPSGAESLTVRVTNVSGDPDLYVRQGARPTTSTYACRPYRGSGVSETCTHDDPAQGNWYIMLRGYSAATGILTASHGEDTECSCANILTNGRAINITVTAGQQIYYCFQAPSTAASTTIRLTEVSGDPDLYTRLGQAPTTSDYDCRPYKGSGVSETCSSSRTGCWHIMIRGYHSGQATLRVGYQ